MSGTTFFTLGLGDVTPNAAIARLATVIESGKGFGFLALVIGYLPVTYQSFSRREVGISLMDAHAGSPPAAVELLRRHRCSKVMSELVGHLHDWESWAADLLESHLSYPVLMYYRSQYDHQSWVAALTTILDVCAILVVGIDDVSEQTAWASMSEIPPEQTPFDRLAPSDFARLKAQLQAMGITLHDEETAEQRLADCGKKYEPYVIGLAKRLAMPLPGWLAEPENLDDWETSSWEHK